jgi:hypothetical protein
MSSAGDRDVASNVSTGENFSYPNMSFTLPSSARIMG